MSDHFSPHIAITADAVVFSPTAENGLFVLLVTRKNEPFKGMYALPGGFVDPKESLVDAAKRELKEETGLDAEAILQIDERSDVDRDPRGRVISFPFIFLVQDQPAVEGSDDADKAEWVDINTLDPNLPNSPKLAFDHLDIIVEAMNALISDALNASLKL